MLGMLGDSRLRIHIIINLWECPGSGSVVQTSVQTNERRVGTQTWHHRALACVDRLIRFALASPSYGGVVSEAVSPIHPKGVMGNSVKVSFLRCYPYTSGSKMN